MLTAALGFFIWGLITFLIGLGLWRLFNASYKAHGLGLDRPLNLSIEEQFILFFRYPSIAIPLIVVCIGVFMLLVSIVAAIVGGIQAIMQIF